MNLDLKQKLHLRNSINVTHGRTDLLKMVRVEILPNFGNYFCTLELGFWKFLSWIVFLHNKSALLFKCPFH